MVGEADVDGEDDGSSTVQALTILLDLAITVIEETHEVAVASVPDDRNAQLARTDILHQAGADLLIIANACKVAIRRTGK